MEGAAKYESGLNLKATELRLGLPGMEEDFDRKQKSSSVRSNKRSLNENEFHSGSNDEPRDDNRAAKKQIVGWPPVKPLWRISGNGVYIKVSMDGAPYLRKVDLKLCKGYQELLKVLMEMFEGYNGSEYVPIYEDREGDWMMVGDVPFEMFMESCKRLRIIKGSEAKGFSAEV